ncbi:MAG: AmmeMemoRadiSam system protein B [Phycisphaerae bacterium]
MKTKIWKVLNAAVFAGFFMMILFTIACDKKESPQPEQEPQVQQIQQPIPEKKIVLNSPLADIGWHEKDPVSLKSQIQRFFDRAQVEPVDNPIALIQPHAGYVYSGQTAAYGLKSLGKNYKRVIVIGPSHRVAMNEIFSVPNVTHFATELGETEIDTEFVGQLLKYSIFQNILSAHQHEHSVHIHIPLLQYKLGDFKLVPIVAGSCSIETIKKAAAILRGMVDSQTLVIASSDFTHYGPNFNYVPFTTDVPEQIKKLDMGSYEHIAALDAEGFLDYKQRTGATICGAVPIALLLSMLEDNTSVKLLNYDTSGRLTGDFRNSVSYLSAVFSGEWPQQKPVDILEGTLSEQDKRNLLTMARKAILYQLQNKRVPSPSDLGVPISDAMKERRAAFVTIKTPVEIYGRTELQLRGCIGEIFPRVPLYQSVISNAVNASQNDPRFRALQMAEYNDIVIEISALTVPKPVARYDEIRVGIDGVVLNKTGRSSVFLPQVAPEQGWNLEEMLTQLSRKAGLPGDAWREGAEFLVYQAEVFGEEK